MFRRIFVGQDIICADVGDCISELIGIGKVLFWQFCCAAKPPTLDTGPKRSASSNLLPLDIRVALESGEAGARTRCLQSTSSGAHRLR